MTDEEILSQFVNNFLSGWLYENNRATMAIIRKTMGPRAAIESLEQSFSRYCEPYYGMFDEHIFHVHKSLFTYRSVVGTSIIDDHFLRLSSETCARLVKEAEQDKAEECRRNIAATVIRKCSHPGALIFWNGSTSNTPFPNYYWAMKFEVINNSGEHQ